MNGHRYRNVDGLSLVVAALTVTAIAAWLPAEGSSSRLCCIGGNYTGSDTASQLSSCPPPKNESFSMTINQGADCDASVWGRITDVSGHLNNFAGTPGPGRGGCLVTPPGVRHAAVTA